jgi:hypothetical protein
MRNQSLQDICKRLDRYLPLALNNNLNEVNEVFLERLKRNIKGLEDFVILNCGQDEQGIASIFTVYGLNEVIFERDTQTQKWSYTRHYLR